MGVREKLTPVLMFVGLLAVAGAMLYAMLAEGDDVSSDLLKRLPSLILRETGMDVKLRSIQ